MPSIKKLKFLKIVILEQGVFSKILSEISPFVLLFQITKKDDVPVLNTLRIVKIWWRGSPENLSEISPCVIV